MDALTGTDWSLLQSFLAVAESGSLSAAARQLGKTQPTIGRHVQMLEQDLGVTLFRRQVRGMALTEQGEALLEHARDMRSAAEALNLTAAGGATDLKGSVRITASVFVSHHLMPSILAGIRQTYPEISLELVASDRSENLLFREADIAVRMYRPRQLDMVALRLGEIELGLWGASRYLDRVGRPTTMTEVMACDFVGYDRDEDIIRGFREAGFAVTRDFFGTRCDNQTVYWELVRAGCGLGFGASMAGGADPALEPVPLDIEIPKLEVWLTAHEAVRHTPRVDAVWQILAAGIGAACTSPPPSS
ncbi:MAG: LysR family transcriptional regulator [Silicimonas sp.]